MKVKVETCLVPRRRSIDRLQSNLQSWTVRLALWDCAHSPGLNR